MVGLPSHEAELPLVTFAIPTLNRVDFLIQAVASIRSQSDGDWEIVVSNNASTDRTLEWLKTEQIKSVSHDVRIELFANWNSALSLARGRYVVLLTDDDLVGRDFVKRLREVDQEHQQCAMVVFNHSVIDETGKELHFYRSPVQGLLSREQAFRVFSRGVENRPCSIAMKREAVEKCGGFDESFSLTAADSELIQKLSVRGPVYFDATASAASFNRVWMGALTQNKLSSRLWQDEILLWTSHIADFASEAMGPKELKISIKQIIYSNLVAGVDSAGLTTPPDDLRYLQSRLKDKALNAVRPKKNLVKEALHNPVFVFLYRKLRKMIAGRP